MTTVQGRQAGYYGNKLAKKIFRLDTASKLSLPRKRKNAAWKPDFLFDLLGLQPCGEIALALASIPEIVCAAKKAL